MKRREEIIYAEEHKEEYRKECHRLIDLAEDPSALIDVYTILFYRVENKKAPAEA